MSEKREIKAAELELPPIIATRTDVSRLLTEVEGVDDAYTTNSVRKKAKSKQLEEIILSKPLKAFVDMNKLDLGEAHERTALIKQLKVLKDSVPSVHMTFSTTADGESLSKLVAWFRKEAHPQTVISVGLQPVLVAGVYLRTPNHVMDLTLRKSLEENRGVLVGELEALSGAK